MVVITSFALYNENLRRFYDSSQGPPTTDRMHPDPTGAASKLYATLQGYTSELWTMRSQLSISPTRSRSVAILS